MRENEDFKRIKGFEQEYFISNYGRVVRILKNGEFREKKATKNHNGYYRVFLWKDSKRKTVRVHRLVAEHFIENEDCFLNTDVHHKNEDKSDNYFENLEWTTHIKNLGYYYNKEFEKMEETHETGL